MRNLSETLTSSVGSDDLVREAQLALWSAYCDKKMELESANERIEQLEAALREIAAGYETKWSTSTMVNMFDVAQILSERISIARAALAGEKKE